jgi:hypothetical protein
VLKERVYVTFTSLAVVVALRAHGEIESPAQAAGILIVTVSGTVLAVLLADLLSHVATHTQLPSWPQLQHMLVVSLGAAVVTIPPLILLALAAIGLWSAATALLLSLLTLLTSLIAISYLALHRLRLPVWQKVVFFSAEAVLGLVVIALDLLAHA